MSERVGAPQGELKFNERYYKAQIVQGEISALSPEAQQYIAELIAERDKYHREARIDMLTALPNRQSLHEWINPKIEGLLRKRQGAEQRQESASSLHLAVIDIDKFKLVNDGVGHKVGDEVLVWLAHEVRTQIRDDDMVARIGGEEFVIGFGGAEQEAAQERLEALRQHIQTASQPKLAEWGITDRDAITISLGLAEFDASCEAYEDVFMRADAALYAAKQDRNKVMVFNPNDPDIASKLREA